jgi:hypothetical protein
MTGMAMRDRAVRRLERRVRLRAPRLVALALVAIAAAAGFLCSFTLLWAGLDGMGARYAVSASAAYVLLLLLLRAWVAVARKRPVREPPPVERVIEDVSELREIVARGRGDLDRRGPSGDPEVELPAPRKPGGGSTLDFLPDAGVDIDVDGPVALAIVGLVLVALGVVAGAAWIVWDAPGLFAELVFDGVIAAGLYRRMRPDDERAWWKGAVRRTLAPAFIVVLLLGVGGLVMQKAVPGAVSVGQVWVAVFHG